MYKYSLFLFLLTLNFACENSFKTTEKQFAHLDKIPDFEFVNQEGETVTLANFENKFYVADFFFTHCPSICVPMAQNMKTVYETFIDEDEVAFLSHTIDPARDTIGRLKYYADKLGVSAPKWQFVRADKEYTYNMAHTYYKVAAMENEDLPGGYDHSGHFILVDKNRKVLAMYNGTKEDETQALIKHIKYLLKQQ